MEVILINNWREIIRVLNDSDKFLSLKDLETKLGLSGKTIKKLIFEHEQEESSNGIKIIRNSRKQYALKILDNIKMNKLIYDSKNKANEMTSRIVFVIEKLILEEDFVRIEEMAEQLFVSRATLDRLMPDIREIFSMYELRLIMKPKYGIKLVGDEVKKRSCYAHEVINKTYTTNNQKQEIIQKILLSNIKKYNLAINDINIYNLVQHCVIALSRLEKNKFIIDSTDSFINEDEENERTAAKEIVKEFEREFRIDIPNNEVEYIKIHLLGKRIIDNHLISEDVFECIDNIVKYILEKSHIDLRGDMELRTSLAIHVQPLLSRLKFGLKQKNPIVQEIKREMPQGFELSFYAAEVIANRYQVTVDDDELAYLALHFSVALDKLEKVSNDKKIVVVCASGRGTARLLQHRLTKRYHIKTENLILLSSLQLDDYDFSDTVCILSTIPLDIEIAIPVMIIDMLFSDSNIQKVDSFMHSVTLTNQLEKHLRESLFIRQKTFEDKEQVISFMYNQIKKEYPKITESFKEQVILRENASSTEVGDCVSLPHPYFYDGEELIICCLGLEKPVKWKFDYVNLVILMAIPQEESFINQKVNEIVINMIGDKQSIIQLSMETTLEKFLELVSRG
ncbi:BglG family transcription antiterminator [Enterococcus casseliflavus]|uniref:BglG family transcription antiterminator n=1 Tax=Enterococcus casseliflavus TaxID=37734 RepID=UPI001883B847|nr:PRD domain-containing protein [Enterococcus casseliflavus]MBE9909318.1 transcription antiterminator [Enterococcus casseliflavus]